MLAEAKNKFTQLLKLLDKNEMESFQTFVFKEFIKHDRGDSENDDEDSYKIGKASNIMEDPVYLLNSIADEIKKTLPIEAVLPSEKMYLPKKGENSDCLPDITIHVDEFLYNEDDIEDLVEQGKLKSHYCRSCGSKNVDPLIYISHSISKEALYYIFNTKLPKLDDKVVLDIGSRLGAVLYGAYVYTDAKKILGVEMNDEFCSLQNSIISKHGLKDRIEIVNDRIENASKIVESADVIILNNAFEFYLPTCEQVAVWKFLKDNLKQGAIVVTRPHIETTFQNIDTGIAADSWLKPFNNPEENRIPFDDDVEQSGGDFCDFAFYQVL